MQKKKRDNKAMETRNVPPDLHTKKKLRMYLIFLFMVFVMLIIVAYTLHKNITYQNMVESAQLQTDLEQRIKKCKMAVRYYPNRTEAYQLMLQSMLADGTFTEEEERIFLSSIKEPAKLEKTRGFGELAYETGKAYLYYYTYGCTNEKSKDMLHPENLIVRMQSCHTWFYKAAMYSKEKKYYEEAIALRDISSFYIENTKRIAEGNDTEKTYLKCWTDIKNLMYITPKKNKAEALRTYEIILDTVLTYHTSLLDSGIAAEDIKLVASDIENSISELKAETAREKSWKKWLLKKQNCLYKMIR